MSLEQEIREQARALGFHRVGIAPATELAVDHARYLDFVERGMHGEMGYLAENRDARRGVGGDAVLPGARSVVVCAMAYRREDAREGEGQRAGDGAAAERGPAGATIARYARGGDYHNFLRKKLRRLAAWLRERVPDAQARPCVDTAPVLERAWARLAGVGFVGKNGCVIAPGLGSFVLLGEVVTTVELAPDAPLESRCGSCTLCLDACPTEAFVAPFVLDARRCVSYLTIELHGPVPVALRDGVGDHLFGCDVCQDVCPYNRTAVPPADSTQRFALSDRWRGTELPSLLSLDADAFRALTEGTPLARAGRAGLARNAALVMGNSGEPRYLPALRAAAEHDPDAAVREAARWAADKLERGAR